MTRKRFVALGLAIIAPFSLSGCLILPGEFVSEMTVMKSGEFSFSYKGQIQLLGLANLMNNSLNGMGADASTETEFSATCWVGSGDDEAAKANDADAKKLEKKKEKAIADSDKNAAALATLKNDKKGTAASATAQQDFEVEETTTVLPEKVVTDEAKPADTAGSGSDAAEAAASAAAEAVKAAAEAASEMTSRDCTKKETAEQKAEWDETQKAKTDREAEQKKLFATLLGGIDPKDPKTIARFTKEVERLAAWNKVEHLGDGLFKIDYSTKGRLADDFAFPVIPRYAIGEPMIHITRWDNGRVRVEAPAFHSDPDFSAMTMLGGGAAAGMFGSGGKPALKLIEVKGTFTLITDAAILANNTEEGPQELDAKQQGGLQKLIWDIGPATFGPPMALLKLVR
jgi:hypothetical protein